MRQPCSVDGCDNPRHARGLCGKHYQSVKKHGDITAFPSTRLVCQICAHPARASIEVAYCGGVPLAEISEAHGLRNLNPEHSIIVHASHAGLTRVRVHGPVCPVCDHPDVEEIDRLLAIRETYPPSDSTFGPRLGCPRSLGLPAIGRRFALGLGGLRNHVTPEHQERRATYEIARLQAIRSAPCDFVPADQIGTVA